MSDFAGFDVGARIGVWRVSGFLGGGLTGEVYLVDETVAPFRRGALKYCRFADDGHRKKFSDEIDIAEARPVPYAQGSVPVALHLPLFPCFHSHVLCIFWYNMGQGG